MQAVAYCIQVQQVGLKYILSPLLYVSIYWAQRRSGVYRQETRGHPSSHLAPAFQPPYQNPLFVNQALSSLAQIGRSVEHCSRTVQARCM